MAKFVLQTGTKAMCLCSKNLSKASEINFLKPPILGKFWLGGLL